MEWNGIRPNHGSYWATDVAIGPAILHYRETNNIETLKHSNNTHTRISGRGVVMIVVFKRF